MRQKTNNKQQNKIKTHEQFKSIENPQSVITSADTKLAYNKDKDRFESVLIGDVNAFPEGLTVINNWTEDDILSNTVDALQSQVPDTGKIALNLPKYAFDNGNNWLINEKNTLAREISNRLDTVKIKSGEGLRTDEDQLKVFDYPVEGYINISDSAAGLEKIKPIHKGANTPYAVWNHDLVETSKLGLLETSHGVTETLDLVSTANYEVVESIPELNEFFPEQGTKILKSDLYGTHGDQVIAFQTSDLEKQIVNKNVRSDIEYIWNRIKEEENRVSSKNNRPSDFRLVDDNGRFNQGITDKAIVEEAVTGTYLNDNGDEMQVLEYDGKPIDLVPLVIYNPETEESELQATTVRTSLDDNLNANRGSNTFEPQSLYETWSKGFNDNVNYKGDLQDLVEELAGREVEFDEVFEPIEEAGHTAYAVRNLTAEKAAENYIEQELGN